jgi:hypothetical protein
MEGPSEAETYRDAKDACHLNFRGTTVNLMLKPVRKGYYEFKIQQV